MVGTRSRASPAAPSPLEEVMVAIDVETTGVDPARDRIIDVAAVKFRGHEEIDRFFSLVNPQAPLSGFITGLTGITQQDVDKAPVFQELAPKLRAFLGTSPVVGQNVAFDAAFLRNSNVPPRGRAYDTFDLAYVLLPGGPEYGLGALARQFNLGHDAPHRALSDARATHALFVALLEKLAESDLGLLVQYRRLAAPSEWPFGELAGRILEARIARGATVPPHPLGLDPSLIARRLRVGPGRREPGRSVLPGGTGEDEKWLERVFSSGGELSGELAGYEQRPAQVAMAKAVAAAIAAGEHLVVEAGTGVGKSLAYLVPGAAHALSGGGAIIVSTNTINLQEQLMRKDLPTVEAVLQRIGVPPGTLRVAALKGRSNYLCYKRWAHAHTSMTPSENEARVLAKCVNWLQETGTGDRAELSLQRFGEPIFSRMSAQGAARCPSQEGPCFLRKARLDAFSADIVVINHSLLLSDLAMGGGLLPPHDALVIDEAHHLEAAATRHLGFEVQQTAFLNELETLGGGRGLITELVKASQSGRDAPAALDMTAAMAESALSELARAVANTGRFYDALREAWSVLMPPSAGGNELRITEAVRSHATWSQVKVAWEEFDLVLGRVINRVGSLLESAERARAGEDQDAEAITLNASAALESLEAARNGLRQSIPEPNAEMVFWLSVRRNDLTTNVHGVPLNVGPLLRETLFEREPCTVLTSGTLSIAGNFARLREAVGLDTGSELALGSPFAYETAALIAVPDDMPEPASPGYAKAVARAVADVALDLRERVLVLFTSYSAMDAARSNISAELEAAGIRVIAQGADGPPHRIMRMLAESPATVALGTSSLWEGVDLEGASIKALIMARLPFGVPTDPVFAARSEQFENGFAEYAVPEAVQRFRQGFGRLIRSHADRGAFIILDRRIISKEYGRLFQKSVPKCTVRRVPLAKLGHIVADWNAGITPDADRDF